MDIKRNIYATFMLIIGLVIMTHSVIPHDHHYDSHSTLEGIEHHHDSDSDADHKPLHCHLFNQVVVDSKIISYQNTKIIIPVISLISYYLLNDTDDLNSDFIIENKILSNKEIFIDISPSRGSPLA